MVEKKLEQAKILIVEDEAITAQLLKDRIKSYGYTICGSAVSGEKAIEIAAKERPDLILMDILLKGDIDGIEAAAHINKDFYVPIIYLSAHDEKEIIERAKTTLPYGYLTKPFNDKELKITIEIALYVSKVENEKRIAEDKLKKYRDHLEELVEKRTQELKTLNLHLKRENLIAQKIFKGIVRDDPINDPNIKYYYSPMDIVGGDIFLTTISPAGSKYYFLGDFTGHGLSAAIGAIPVSDIFYKMAAKGRSVGEIVDEINKKLSAILPTELFLCACLIEMDNTTGLITMWNGGIPDVLVIESGKIRKKLPSAHLPLGITIKNGFDDSLEVFEISPSDRIYLYTDGVIEATNRNDVIYGKERFERLFYDNQEPEKLFDEICSGLASFMGNDPQSDDIAIVEINSSP